MTVPAQITWSIRLSSSEPVKPGFVRSPGYLKRPFLRWTQAGKLKTDVRSTMVGRSNGLRPKGICITQPLAQPVLLCRRWCAGGRG